VVRNVFDHPVCASKVASQLFLIAQPPLLWRRGLAGVFRILSWGNMPFSPRSILTFGGRRTREVILPRARVEFFNLLDLVRHLAA
jgi:hypothetical protein